MDSLRNISLVSVAQLVVLNAISPIMAESFDEENKHHRHHQHGHVQPVSHSRADYPVIWGWLSSPDTTTNSAIPAE